VAVNLTLVVVQAMLAWSPAAGTSGGCTYRSFRWDVVQHRAVAHVTVHHPYADVSPEERDAATGCTVCEEDQDTVAVPGLAPFLMCRVLAPAAREALTELIRDGAAVRDVVGYHVGRTRGDPDGQGRRTGFSNHAYGIALDINPAQNGLYDRCEVFGPQCRLLCGGLWRPEANDPGTLTASGPIVRRLAAAGFKWGGAIAGRQKDFMHFSPTGY
jgi:hypothetical protein